MVISTEAVTGRDGLSVIPTQPSTLNEALRRRALRQAERHAYTFLDHNEQERERWTYADLDRKARIIGAQLQDMGAADQRVLLLYQPGLDFIAAFCGCLYAGAVAIPARRRPDRTRFRPGSSPSSAMRGPGPC